MNKLEAVKDAEKYADMLGRIVYVLRRGQNYQSSQNEKNGWSVAEMVAPHTGLTPRH